MQVTRVRSRMSGDMMTLFLLALAIFSAARELHHARMSACVGMCVALQSAYLEGLGSLQQPASVPLKQSAYTSVNGTDPGGPTDSYSPDGIAEASTGSQAIGVYYREGVEKDEY
jgi:hypothetical protein